MSMHPMASAYAVMARRAKGRMKESRVGLTCFHTTKKILRSQNEYACYGFSLHCYS